MSTVLPEIETDSSAVDWKEFMVSWAKHKEKFNLAGPGLIRQVITCLQFIDSLSHRGQEADIISDQQDSNLKGSAGIRSPAQVKVAGEIVDTKAHIQDQDKSRSGRRSRKKSRKKTLVVREERLHSDTFLSESTSYQPEDFTLNSLTFGEIAALMDCEMSLSGVTNSSVLGYNKYRIRVDGSGRVTDRNRQFLRLFSAVRAGTLILLSSLTASTALCELECELCRDIAEKVDTRRKLKMYAQVLIILEEENAKLKYV